MVDEEIANSIPVLLGISEQIKASKQTVMDNFKTILEMKADLFKTKVKDDQRSHTFTNSEGDKRITLGVYVTDGYRDTVEDGIAIVKEYIEGLAKDEKTKALVSMVLRLLARDAKGTLKASRIVQLRKVAMETGDDRFIEGVRIIEEAYQPEVSKQFIRAEIKNENGMWKLSSGNDRIINNRTMIQEVEKSPKVALCRACYGTGKVKKVVEYPSRIFGKKRSETVEEVCRQCEGSGRVTVSAKMTLDIRPYKPKVEPSMND